MTAEACLNVVFLPCYLHQCLHISYPQTQIINQSNLALQYKIFIFCPCLCLTVTSFLSPAILDFHLKRHMPQPLSQPKLYFKLLYDVVHCSPSSYLLPSFPFPLKQIPTLSWETLRLWTGPSSTATMASASCRGTTEQR